MGKTMERLYAATCRVVCCRVERSCVLKEIDVFTMVSLHQITQLVQLGTRIGTLSHVAGSRQSIFYFWSSLNWPF